MPTFRHPGDVKLVLHDGEKVWGESHDGVLELAASAAKRFRGGDMYGFVEDEPKRAAAKQTDPASGDSQPDGGDPDASGQAPQSKE